MLKIIEWNMGSRHWLNKRDKIQAMVDDQDPDIIYITEANLFKSDPDYLVNIVGYNLVKPKT